MSGEMVAVVMQQSYGANVGGEVCGFRKDIAEDLIKRKVAVPYVAPKTEEQKETAQKQSGPQVTKQAGPDVNKQAGSDETKTGDDKDKTKK